MGHYCRICGGRRPNEAFSGRGHARHVCKACSREPRRERDRLELGEELWGYWFQSNLSTKNLKRLEALGKHEDAEIRAWAALLRAVGLIHPRRRNRLGELRKRRPDLLDQLVAQGFVEERQPYDEIEEPVWDDDPTKDEWGLFEDRRADEDLELDDLPF